MPLSPYCIQKVDGGWLIRGKHVAVSEVYTTFDEAATEFERRRAAKDWRPTSTVS